MFNQVAIRAPQQLIKLRRGLEYEGHALMDVGQIGKVIIAEANGASVFAGAALAGQSQFDGCSGAGRKIRHIREVIANEQSHQIQVTVHCWLKDVLLFMLGKKNNTFDNAACINGLEGLQDFLMVITESQPLLLDRPQDWMLIITINFLT